MEDNDSPIAIEIGKQPDDIDSEGRVGGIHSKHPYNDTLHAKKHFGLDAFGPTLQDEDGKKSDVGFSGGFGDVIATQKLINNLLRQS